MKTLEPMYIQWYTAPYGTFSPSSFLLALVLLRLRRYYFPRSLHSRYHRQVYLPHYLFRVECQHPSHKSGVSIVSPTSLSCHCIAFCWSSLIRGGILRRVPRLLVAPLTVL